MLHAHFDQLNGAKLCFAFSLLQILISFSFLPPRDSVVKGKVVFATKDSSPYDIALVELGEGLSTLPELPLASAFHPGENRVMHPGWSLFFVILST